jgi:hypothetical protein
MSQFDVLMQIVCLQVGFFVALGIPALCCGVIGWLGGEYVGRRDANIKSALTDSERNAIEDAIKTVSEALDLMNGEDSFTTATLRNLLARLA